MFTNLSKGMHVHLSNPSVKRGGGTMTKLITVDRAKVEIKRLQHYVDLVEAYDADTLDKAILKEYAITNSIDEVSRRLNTTKEYISTVIRRRGTDELHKLIRSGYMVRTRPHRH